MNYLFGILLLVAGIWEIYAVLSGFRKFSDAAKSSNNSMRSGAFVMSFVFGIIFILFGISAFFIK
ncbi:MAG: immunity protein [Lactobacillaceae bacterium]|jgi:hypothetical protein|nr:immunity protein [Lactobacillaceae bacterium]